MNPTVPYHDLVFSQTKTPPRLTSGGESLTIGYLQNLGEEINLRLDQLASLSQHIDSGFGGQNVVHNLFHPLFLLYHT